MAGKIGRAVARGMLGLALLLGFGAIYYSTLTPPALLLGLSLGYALAALTLLILAPFRRAMLGGTLLVAVVALWYAEDTPANNRDWAPEYAIPATATVRDGVVTIDNIRDFSYGPGEAVTPHYYNASFALDQLTSADLVASYWSGEAIAHLFLTFNFADGRHLAISIETRRQQRFAYSAIAGFFRHYELFYVVADERDVIGLRADARHERVYLYRLQIAPARARALFISYVLKIQALAADPQWYNTLTDNCTTGILARARAPEPFRLHWRLVLSGYVPEYAYSQGLLDQGMSFALLRAGSLIPALPITPAYSQAIRAALPAYPRG